MAVWKSAARKETRLVIVPAALYLTLTLCAIFSTNDVTTGALLVSALRVFGCAVAGYELIELGPGLYRQPSGSPPLVVHARMGRVPSRGCSPTRGPPINDSLRRGAGGQVAPRLAH